MVHPSSVTRTTAGLLALFACATAHAQMSESLTRLPEFFVNGDRVGRLELVVPRADLRKPEPNLGPELLAMPGVYGQTRATDAMEPNIRGLGFDRVATTLNGLPVLNASPERTNSPVVILGPVAVTRIVVTKALPSVTLGPVTTAGTIALTTTPGMSSGRSDGCSASASVALSGAREGTAAQIQVATHEAKWDLAVTGFRDQLGDFTAADGRRVAAKLEDEGASVDLGWQSQAQLVHFGVVHRRLQRQDAVSLPLDGKNSDSDVLTMNYRWLNPDGGALRRVDARAGYSLTDPYITSEERSAPALTFAKANARSVGAGFSATWSAPECDTVVTGADYTTQDRRAVRTTTAGNDYIWPGVVSQDAGFFGEWTRSVAPQLQLRMGGRMDAVHNDARDVDHLALGRTLREQFIAYNGPAATRIGRQETIGAANMLLTWTDSDRVSAFFGAGLSAQTAPATERFRAFLNALGGDGRGGNAFELGNPALAPERKTAVETGGAWHATYVDFEATAYYYRVDDFILRTPVGFTASPPPRIVVFGYRNVLADFFGGELGGTIKPHPDWSIPLTLATAGGRNRTNGSGLAELPPWEATAVARYRNRAARVPFAVEAGMRIVGSKDNPAPLDNPLFGRTGGFVLWHIRTGTSLRHRFKLEAGIENVFNRRYTEYLSPPVAPIRPASGDLLPGDRIPGIGRNVWASLSVTW